MKHGLRRLRGLAVVPLAALVILGAPTPAVGGATTCALVPQLRDVTINQGLGAYSLLARGKETLVKLYLQMPSCAGVGASMSYVSGSLQVLRGDVPLGTIGAPYAPAAGSAPAPISRSTAAPALDAPADAKFVVAGSLLAPASTVDRFPVRFTTTINYQSKTSKTAPIVNGSVTLSSLTSGAAIASTVERRTNAMRVLIVPMGDASQPYDSEFDALARTTTQNGLTALARMLPVPDGIGDLASPTGGLRYTINPSLLDLSSALNSDGKFCGTSSNFASLKPTLAQFLQSWNTANPQATADKVLGVVKDTRTLGSAQGCAEGIASVSSPEAWVRLIPDAPGVPSNAGSLMAMEISHTLGLVTSTRDDPYSDYHSPNREADVPSPNRGYNVSLRSFLAQDRTALTLSTDSNNTTTIFEKDDWAFLLCALGGATTSDCATSGTLGTPNGVGADPTFVITGNTDGTVANVLESYFAAGVPRTAIDPASEYVLRYLRGSTVLESFGVPVYFAESAHDHVGDGQTQTHPVGLFSSAFPYDTSATRIELRRGSQLLYERNRNGKPRVTGLSVTGGSTGTGGTEFRRISEAADGSQSDGFSSSSDVSGDGKFVAFESDAANLVPGDTNENTDVFVRDRDTGAVELISRSMGATGTPGDSYSINPSISADGRYVAFESFASNLVADDTNVEPDVFRYDRQTGDVIRVSVGVNDSQATGYSYDPEISGDGQFVVFSSDATDLVTGDTNAETDVFLRNLGRGTTERVSVGSAGLEANGDSATVSDDGRYVAFRSSAASLGVDSAYGGSQIFRLDRATDTTIAVSVDPEGALGDGFSGDPVITPDGSAVVFESSATNLVGEGDTGGFTDIFLRTIDPGNTERVSVAAEGGEAVGDSFRPDISDDGRFVAFASQAVNLAASDSGRDTDVFLRDRQLGTTEHITVVPTATPGPSPSPNPSPGEIFEGGCDGPCPNGNDPAVDGAGGVVSFTSSQQFVEEDTNGQNDVYVRAARPAPRTGRQPVTVLGTDEFPAALLLDLFYRCGGVDYVVAVALTPSAADATTATFDTVFDPSLACADGTLIAVLTDGIDRSDQGPDSQAPAGSAQKPPTAAIYGPTAGQAFLQFDSIPMVGTGKDAEDGQLGGSALQWAVTGPGGGVVATGSGPAVDLPSPSDGWAPGSYTARLTATDSSGLSDDEQVTYTILPDADHDGLSALVESGSCFPAGSDAEPANHDADHDLDGIPNNDDLFTAGGPCGAATSYRSFVTFSPDPFPIHSSGNTVTVSIRLPYRSLSDIVANTVKITQVAGRPATFSNIGWTVDAKKGVGTAKFDRVTLERFFTANPRLLDHRVNLLVEGTGRPRSGSTFTFAGLTSTFIQNK
ncbi:MAG TPA: hypothetical protein VNB94_03180 [Mycobacteriales bacterium]|nr:hypothetical protein [Mycobacteriales bacterium]